MNQRQMYRMLGIAAGCVAAALPARALPLRCPQDSVNVGGACVDNPASPATFDATGNWTSTLLAVSGYLNGRV